MSRCRALGVLVIVLVSSGVARADIFLDLTSLTPGGPGAGSFAGTLGTVGVTGSMVLGPPIDFAFAPIGIGIGNSTIDNTSPAFSYASVFNGTNPLGDRIGWSSGGTTTNTIVITFSAPVTNPIFHVANLDSAQFSFIATPGITGLTLLNSNTSGGDGLGISGLSLIDTSPLTFDATAPTTTPPIAGGRSAYGSVMINGTFSTLVIGTGTTTGLADNFGGSFTISVVPEPNSLILIGIAAFFGLRVRRSRAL
jgi:PEP-CTERM motif